MHFCVFEIKHFNKAILKKTLKNFPIAGLFHYLGYPVPQFHYMPTRTKTFTVIRSPFIHKKSQEHFGTYSNKVIFTFHSDHFKRLTLLINYILKKFAFNMQCQITKTYKYKII